MIDELQLLSGADYVINDRIRIRSPTLKEIVAYGEQRYFALVSSLCATPSDYKVQLLDLGLDYEEVDEFELFWFLSRELPVSTTKILFGNLNLTKFKSYKTDTDFYVKNKNGVVIDRGIFTLITNYLRQLHGFKKNVEIAGNEETKQYLLEKARRKLRHKSKDQSSPLAPLVSAMVNYSGFKYDYETVWSLRLYMFMDAVNRAKKIVSYDHVMQGVYAGTIDQKKLSEDKMNWLGSLSEN